MPNVITQSIILPAPAERLYEMYLDPALHEAFTGHPVAIAAHSGAEFRAFDGQLTGRILAVVRPSLIVQGRIQSMRTISNLMQAHSLTFFASESCSRGTSRSALTMDESRYLLGCPATRPHAPSAVKA